MASNVIIWLILIYREGACDVKRWVAALLGLAACLLLSGCDVASTAGSAVSDASPNTELLSLSPYVDAEAASEDASSAGADYVRVDLWLDATQNMGGVNTTGSELFPHYGKKYREGGFHYHYGTTAGWYESLLMDMLSAAEGSRVRTLRYGNEQFTDAQLTGLGLTSAGASADERASVRRDLYTYDVDTDVSLFPAMTNADMTGGFYQLGTEKLNQIADLDANALENPSLASAMDAALQAQIASIASGSGEYVIQKSRTESECALLNALNNLDLSRLSVITCDYASIRSLSGTDENGAPVAFYEQALSRAFDEGLCAGVLSFTLDYMGQLSTVGAADLAVPIIWGHPIYNNTKQVIEYMAAMPRELLTLVVGTRAQVEGYISRLSERIDADSSLKGLRGPTDGELTYAVNGATVTQQPFGFAWSSTIIARPGMGYYTQHTAGASLTASDGSDISDESGLMRATLRPDKSGDQPDRVLTVRFPLSALADGAQLDLSKLTGASVSVIDNLLLTDVIDNTAANAATIGDRQALAYRDKLYVFASDDGASPFALKSVTQDGDEMVCAIAVSGSELSQGYYRLRVSADVTGDQVSWEPIDWIDGDSSADASISDADIYAWETFTALIRDNEKNTPRRFTNAWGSYSDKKYNGETVPDCPPIWKAIGLRALTEQLRAAAESDGDALVRYVLEVYVAGATS